MFARILRFLVTICIYEEKKNAFLKIFLLTLVNFEQILSKFEFLAIDLGGSTNFDFNLYTF